MPAVFDPSRPQVILVHGIWDNATRFDKMAAALAAAGWQAHAVSLTPNDASVPLEKSAEQLGAFVDRSLGPDRHFSIVAFSMGGLVARYYLQRLDGLPRLDRLVTISSPHHGTWTADFDWMPGAVQMRPGSTFLKDLNRDVTRLEVVPFTSIWSPQDIGIQPPRSSELPFGVDVPIIGGRHSSMLTDDRVIGAVLDALGTRGPGAACTAAR